MRLLSRFAEWAGVAPALQPRHRQRIDLQAAVAVALADRDTPEHLRRAAATWADGILEPGQRPVGPSAPAPEAIDAMIRDERAGAWDWLKPYKKNGQTSWCGHFVSYCCGEALPEAFRRSVLASTYRLWQAAADGQLVRLAPGDARPGDVLVVKHARSDKRWGDHITLVERVDHSAGLVHTIEGNARGRVPGGLIGNADDAREGVIRRTRPMGRASRARCPISGLRQSSGAFAVYRLPLEG